MKVFRFLSLALVLGFSHGVKAESCEPQQSQCAAIGQWEFALGIGLGMRTNPVVNGDDIPLVLIPQVSYYGQRFFIENLEMGFTLVERPRFQVNALVTPGGDGLYFFRRGWRNIVLDGGLDGSGNPFSSPRPPDIQDNYSPASPEHQMVGPAPSADERRPGFVPTEESGNTDRPNLMPDDEPENSRRRRHLAAMAGLEASAALGPVNWQLQLLTDVSGVHNGEELRFALGHKQRLNQHHLALAGGFSWKSADLLEYYYGIRADEATEQAPAYHPDSGVSPFVRLSWSKAMNRNWRWQGSLQYDHLSDAVRHSPLIEDNHVVQVFFGGVYHF